MKDLFQWKLETVPMFQSPPRPKLAVHKLSKRITLEAGLQSSPGYVVDLRQRCFCLMGRTSWFDICFALKKNLQDRMILRMYPWLFLLNDWHPWLTWNTAGRSSLVWRRGIGRLIGDKYLLSNSATLWRVVCGLSLVSHSSGWEPSFLGSSNSGMLGRYFDSLWSCVSGCWVQ